MIVTIWRHGKAARAASDDLRELTRQGKADVTQGAATLRSVCQRRQQSQPDQLWYSRWVRTSQTASIVQQQFQCARQDELEALIPGASPADVEEALQSLWPLESRPRHLVLISHQPLVSTLTDVLLGVTGSVPSHPPGGFVSLQLDAPAPGCASLLWWAFPPCYDVEL